jgi:predicted nuclease with TOPRIM domain
VTSDEQLVERLRSAAIHSVGQRTTPLWGPSEDIQSLLLDAEQAIEDALNEIASLSEENERLTDEAVDNVEIINELEGEVARLKALIPKEASCG